MTRFRTFVVLGFAASSAIAGATAILQEVSLPEGLGRQQIVDSCTRCHGVDIIVAQPRSSDEWSEVVGTMIGQGAVLTDDEYETVVTYLSKNLAPKENTPD